VSTTSEEILVAERIRVRGAVQGVGFRPMVWRLATEHGLRGWVSNDAQGVVMLVAGSAPAVEAFFADLPAQVPPLARIDAIEREAVTDAPNNVDFRIIASRGGKVRTGVVADAATCPACLAEIADPAARRYRYPFTNCTHCGPRLSIIEAIPYDRAATTMKDFPLCAECAAEYEDPADRRFHAQPIACPACGPRIWLEDADGEELSSPFKGEAGRGMGETPPDLHAVDAIDSACTLLEHGAIVAIKGLGGFQLACDAGNASAVARLRQRKQRERKPFALMVRDLDAIRRYCTPSDTEAALLHSPAAPIVILETNDVQKVAPDVAPGVATLGFMLPNTPLHHLLLQRMDRPIVLTSGNLSDEPQCIDNADARVRLGGIADYFLLHDRGIARRVDDSVVRVLAGKPRLLRRARGYAPASLRLPEGFAAAPPVLAMGGELKNTFCLLTGGEAIVSHHMGDLADARCYADYVQSVAAYRQLFEYEPRVVAVDKHPEYLSRKLGMAMAEQHGLACAEIQHHHAHLAACMAENDIPLDTAPILGVALDGLGYGDDGTLWGGEILLADYRQCRRVVCLKPAAMPGGTQAIYEPWRNTYAQLTAALGWDRFAERYGELDLCRFLAGKPRGLLDGMMARNVNSPLASSCGRLFDAVAAAAGVCRERVVYEGQAAVEFEALIDARSLTEEDDALAYPFAISHLGNDGLPCVDPLPMWQALLADLAHAVPVPTIAARFHKGLAIVIADMLKTLGGQAHREQPLNTVALSGGVFQNRVLLEQVVTRLESAGFTVLKHRRLPANDGGLALGQAVIAAARALV
jgi:hydrogenase maturation protein HypF